MDAPDPSAGLRKRKPKERKAEIVKIKKTKGEEHVNHVGKTIQQKVVGPDCRCKRHECFNNIDEEQRNNVLQAFYAIPSKDLQDAHLSGLIQVEPIKQRRSRKPLGDANNDKSKDFNSAAFYYKIRIIKDNITHEVPVCRSAFTSIHGVSYARIRRLQQSLVTTASAPQDKRGKHANRPPSLPKEIKGLIDQHICAFKPRKSHYFLRRNPDRSYLPETLCVKRMHKMFLHEHRINVPYKTYWSIFHNEYNIRFGVPRSDTCTVCDALKTKIESSEDRAEVERCKTEHELHLKKAKTFYDIKKIWKQKAREGLASVISFNFMQNLPLPHIPTNTIFYCRQLWYYVFGVHNLSNDDASMYLYHEAVGKKGQNDVTSLLLHFLSNAQVLKDELILFSDGCSGQNKNYVMLHFLYMLVHCLKMFKSVMYVFPIRGHSYLPNDQDFAIIEKRKRLETAETPDEWGSIIKECRENPSPFNVVNVQQDFFFNIKEATDPYFLKSPKPAIALKTLRMYRIKADTPLLGVRDHFSGPWRTCIIRNKKRMPTQLDFEPMYAQGLPVNRLKMNDLKKLYSFLKPKSKSFYDTLSVADDHTRAEVDMSDNSSGEDE